VNELHTAAKAAGRCPSDLRIFSMATVIVDETDEAAQAKLQDYRKYIDHEGTLALMSGWTGIDFAKYRLDDVLEDVQTDAMRTAIDNFTSSASDRKWTIKDIAEFGAIGGRGPVFVGSPSTIADRMEKWVDESGVDGFNLAYAVFPETFTDFIRLVIPELQRRGLFKTAYESGTMREKLFGADALLPSNHPAAKFRFDAPC
jgi:alkanesulfonate monooxygenase